MDPNVWPNSTDNESMNNYKADDEGVNIKFNWTKGDINSEALNSEFETSYVKSVQQINRDDNSVNMINKDQQEDDNDEEGVIGFVNDIIFDQVKPNYNSEIDGKNKITAQDNLKRPKSLFDSKIKNDEIIANGNNNKCLRVKFSSKKRKKTSSSRSKKEINKEQPSPSSISTSSCSPSTGVSSDEDNSSFEQFAEARPPDGGWGWVVVAAAFMVNLIADGITFSFGVIYVEFLNYFGEGKSKTAWIGSLFMAMPLLSGPVASFLTDRYGCRRVSIAGSILATLGFVISSFTSSMGVLIFTFGVVAGFGLSLCFVAAVVIVAYYFDKKRSFATGLSVCGSGIGTFIFAPVTQYLLAEYGWRGTTLILAGLFLNLAVCGCLMRDLEWTTVRAKAKCEERKRNRERKRTSRLQSSSVDSFSASLSINTTTQTPHTIGNSVSANPVDTDCLRRINKEDNNGKLFSSLLTLPTFLKNGDQVPLEVLDLLSTRKDVYNVLMHNYPRLLTSSRSISDSATLNDPMINCPTVKTGSPHSLNTPQINQYRKNQQPKQQNQQQHQQQHTTEKFNNSVKLNSDKIFNSEQQDNDDIAFNIAYLWWLNKNKADCSLKRSATLEAHRRVAPAYLRNVRVHRHSLTYRGAMLNINRYRLRASSCPDIYRNSMTTIAKTKFVWYSGLWEFWDLLVDMLDFSHFGVSEFLLFSISNFLLHTWYDVPYVYLTDNAIEMGFSETDASILISVIGIANMFGEIFLGWAGDRAWVNASIVYALCMIFCGIATSLIPLVTSNYYALCSVSAAFGIFIAANYSLTSIILVEVITLERFTNAYGLLLLVQGIANLMGPPLAGWLYDITGTYDLSFYLAGFFIGLSGVLLMVVPLMGYYKKFFKRKNADVPRDEFAEINSV
ncbi:uncharacterized protein LOC103573997 [Microplitis demolitor]|uniref:uncharacterized protein LOC103573997 n=1 Tax=Microplitis demolitor TaxID=69319 RepID=UPI00235B5DDB|nr:uncharacterized protein LOC103573997 [Microplitis demolitor]XP_053594977.1 uncharacterized protein LOC103573997 [Microplitis demolitor]XP_053594978.1 uncharacterized protein LOC103573997 [Microplitis demolitor]XP_053594979.1 uncharacterized protein LOC103573997 [Microplitis demolitor]